MVRRLAAHGVAQLLLVERVRVAAEDVLAHGRHGEQVDPGVVGRRVLQLRRPQGRGEEVGRAPRRRAGVERAVEGGEGLVVHLVVREAQDLHVGEEGLDEVVLRQAGEDAQRPDAGRVAAGGEGLEALHEIAVARPAGLEEPHHVDHLDRRLGDLDPLGVMRVRGTARKPYLAVGIRLRICRLSCPFLPGPCHIVSAV